MLLTESRVNTISTTNDIAEVGALRSTMPDLYFVNTTAAQMKRHIQLLRRLPQEKLILDFHRPVGTLLTELTLCAYDGYEPGLLAKVCGTLSALRVDIHTAFIYTARDVLHNQSLDDRSEIRQDGKQPRWITFDSFLLTEPYHGHDGPLSADTMRRVRYELTRVLEGQVTAEHLLAKARHRTRPSITTCSIALNNGEMRGHTRITLRTETNPGVLYQMANALSTLDLSICIAQINTFEASTDDTFFVTDRKGQPVPEKELAAIGMRLRALLQDSAAPIGLTR
jgi:UTP:GlnB (protein PII) uridylyltransferase